MPIENNEACYGCGVCSNVCNFNAIKMIRDGNGFSIPSVDVETCVSCGKCNKVCPINNSSFLSPIKAYAVQIIDREALLKSTSGGAFTLISDEILRNGGSVFASVSSNNGRIVKFEKTTTTKHRDDMRKVYYVQSSFDEITDELIDSLQNHLTLFVGTPCQVSAIKNRVSKNCENLITIDLFCHGVMSPKILKDHIKFMESRKNCKIQEFCFRTKQYGWMAATSSIVLLDNKIKSPFLCASLKHIYHSSVAMRSSCYSCQFAEKKRVGDFSIGDLWNLKKYGILNDNYGYSCVFLNSQKAVNLFDKVKKYSNFSQLNIGDISQQALRQPVKGKTASKLFYSDYRNHGYEYIIRKYGNLSAKEYLSAIKHKIVWTLGLDKILLKIVNKR